MNGISVERPVVTSSERGIAATALSPGIFTASNRHPSHRPADECDEADDPDAARNRAEYR